MRTKNFEAIIHKGIYDLLKTQYSNVYDTLPDNVNFPFITIGEPDVSGELAKNLGSSTVRLDIHLFSNYKGKKEIYGMVENVITLLNSLETTITEIKVLFMGYDIIYQEEDEGIKHAIIRLNLSAFE